MGVTRGKFSTPSTLQYNIERRLGSCLCCTVKRFHLGVSDSDILTSSEPQGMS